MTDEDPPTPGGDSRTEAVDPVGQPQTPSHAGESLGAGVASSRRRRRWLIALAGVVVVALLATGGTFGARELQDRLRQDRLDTALSRGRAAHGAADCGEALHQFVLADRERVTPRSQDDPVTELIRDCERLEGARAQVEPGSRLLAYTDYVMGASEADPLRSRALAEGRDLLTDTSAGALTADVTLCYREMLLVNAGILAKSRVDVVLPPILWQCALRLSEETPRRAKPFLIRLVTQFPEAEYTERATERLVKGILKEIKGPNDDFGRQPFGAPSRGLPAGAAMIVIYNGAPSKTEMAVGGSGFAYKVVRACGTCTFFASEAAGHCKLRGPHAPFVVPAGRVKVIIRSPGSTRALVGTWTVTGGRSYSTCIFNYG